MAESITVLVSYASETDNEKKIIKDLMQFDSKFWGVKVIYAKKDLKTGGSIAVFGKRISEGDKIIIVFSDAYFKSKWCMSELLVISETGHFEKRVFPIVVGSCDLSRDGEYRAQLKKFWGEKKSTSDNSQDIADIVENLDKMLDPFSHLKHISFDELKSSNYRELKDFIQPKLPSWVWPTVKGLVCSVVFFGLISIYLSNKLNESEIKLKDQRETISNLNGKIEVQKVKEEERSKKEIIKRLSLGEKYFLEAYFDKRIGAKDFSRGEFEDAESGFKKALKEMPDDPEALIYSENAWVQTKSNKNGKQIRTIAVSVPIQKNVTAAKEILRGVAQAQWEINQKWRTKCGKPVERDKDCSNRMLLQVQIASDDNDPDIAEGIANYIANEKKDILAVVGHNSSEVSNRVIKEYQGKLVMLSPTSYTLNHAANEILNAKNNYIYSMTPPLESTLSVVIDYIKDLEVAQKNRRMYLCADPNAHDTARFINGLNNKIHLIGFEKEKEKYKIVCDISELKEKDDFLETAKKAYQLTDLFLSVHVSTIIDAVILARRADNKLNLYNAHTLFSRDVLRKEFNGLVTVVSWHSKSPHDDKESETKSNNFIEDARCIWNGKKKRTDKCLGKFDPDIDITWRSAMAYDATQLIIERLNKIPLQVTGDEARKELQEQFSGLGLESDGVTGSIKFAQNGMRIGGEGHLVQVLERCDGKYQFVPIEKQNDSSYKLVFPEGVKFKDNTPKDQCA